MVIVGDSDGLGNLRARDRGFCDGRQRVVVVVVVLRGRRRERLEWEGRNGAEDSGRCMYIELEESQEVTCYKQDRSQFSTSSVLFNSTFKAET